MDRPCLMDQCISRNRDTSHQLFNLIYATTDLYKSSCVVMIFSISELALTSLQVDGV